MAQGPKPFQSSGNLIFEFDAETEPRLKNSPGDLDEWRNKQLSP
jgi:hypothetical protein